MESILIYIATTIIGMLLGNIMSNYKKQKIMMKAFKNLLKSQLVNQCYVHKQLGEVDRYIRESWYAMYESYTELGGNSYIHDIIEPEFAKAPMKEE